VTILFVLQFPPVNS